MNTVYNQMNTETQKEFDIKQKFVLDNQKEYLAGGAVPGFKEAMLWLKNTKAAHLNKEATEANKKALHTFINTQKTTPSYKKAEKAFQEEAKSTKGYW
jgi:hypothetical protein